MAWKKWQGKLAKIIAYPGLKLQELTTKEPDDSSNRSSDRSLKVAEGIEDK